MPAATIGRYHRTQPQFVGMDPLLDISHLSFCITTLSLVVSGTITGAVLQANRVKEANIEVKYFMGTPYDLLEAAADPK